MNIKQYEEATPVIAHMKELQKNAALLMVKDPERPATDHYGEEGICPLVCSFTTLSGVPIKAEVSDATKWSMWDLLVDHFGKEVMEVERDLSYINPRQKAGITQGYKLSLDEWQLVCKSRRDVHTPALRVLINHEVGGVGR